MCRSHHETQVGARQDQARQPTDAEDAREAQDFRKESTLSIRKKSTIVGSVEDVETCQEALHVAISILQLNIGATSVEQLRDLDTKLAAGSAKLELALSDLRISNNAANDEISQQLSAQRKILLDETQRRKALEIIEPLK